MAIDTLFLRLRSPLALVAALLLCRAVAVEAIASSDTIYAPPPYSFGIYGQSSAAFTWSATTNFGSLPGVPNCCPSFREAFGWGNSFGIMYDIPLSSYFALHIRGGIARDNLLFAREEATTVAMVGGPGQGYVREEGRIRYDLEMNFFSLQFETFGAYKASPSTDLLLGTRFNVIQENDFTQQEILVAPGRGTFENGRRIRNDSSGTLMSVSQLQVSLAAGIRYHLPLVADKSLMLSPELFFSFNLNAPVNGILFNINTIRGGLSLSFGPRRPIVPEKITRSEPIPIRKTTPILTVRSTGITPEGDDVGELTVERRVVQRREVRALLPYIFFGHNSPRLPTRYTAITKKQSLIFESEKLLSSGDDPLFHYHHILNIVGERLRKHPDATLTVTGCNNGQKEERNNLTLSRERALAVKKYLIDVWGIEPLRIITESVNLPSRPTKETTPDGIAENRRVELYSSDPAILAPLTADLPVGEDIFAGVRVRPRVTEPEAVSGWYMKAYLDEQLVRKESGSGSPPPLVEWNFSDIAPSLENGDLLFVEMETLLNNGETLRSRTAALPVRLIARKFEQYRRQGNASIHRFALLLFEFDTLTTRQHIEVISSEIKRRISPLSEITIIGHTDRTGTAEYNYRLAEERADQAVRLLNLDGRASVIAAGQSKPLFTNELPEGRFYNRTAEVIIKTPD